MESGILNFKKKLKRRFVRGIYRRRLRLWRTQDGLWKNRGTDDAECRESDDAFRRMLKKTSGTDDTERRESDNAFSVSGIASGVRVDGDLEAQLANLGDTTPVPNMEE